MSVYNGQRFLPEQLHSLAAQRECPDWILLWRDDGSSDRSIDILSDFKCARRVTDRQSRLGPAMSFFQLLAAADGGADAFAFCDQDDHLPASRPRPRSQVYRSTNRASILVAAAAPQEAAYAPRN